uniref:Cold-induced thioredoxin domain-containing protein n=1 Tax=Kwoniella pini CBS 10737 TaxID=1296096 RepID=A0A1B9HYJ8_9TREE|nr:cold-induced thioredoxin domain-containing protein [Kwoniella pini CBS 10737]OCF48355.1 cold-induced thioredoxin domain-containing protein [Kwoniella pini CBS 10737]
MSSSTSIPELTNVLGKSKSPYLLQHKDNPVAWQEFTPSTIQIAKKLDKPIFLSSGYSACHWCHVLAHESFEDEEVAETMNKYFVNIKVDREERPDVDRVYMTYLQATSGGGGWPMSIFMTPNLEPFFAGTYFPKVRFKSLLMRIAELWEEDKEQCLAMGKGAIESMKDMSGSSARIPGTLDEILSTCPSTKIYSQLLKLCDTRYGGFTQGGSRSSGPKFPSCSMTLEPLARLASYSISDQVDNEKAREMAIKMIRGIWKGGIHDWIGGGVARYSVDAKWIVPHFEKMLYDQAQLVIGALDFALLSNPKLCFDLAADILKYTLRDLKSPDGGFWSAEDADSPPSKGAKKSEGAFYIWDARELDEVLAEDSDLVKEFFGVKDDGNVELQHDMHGEMKGKNILYQAKGYDEVARQFGRTADDVRDVVKNSIVRLKARRDQRERPGLDDKILTSWNGLMLSTLSQAASTLPETYPIKSKCLPAAEAIVSFIKDRMWDESKRELARSWREGKGPIGQTDDYAFLIRGLLDLYESSGKEEYALWAIELQEHQDELFWDETGDGYFASASDEHVLVRMKDAQDAAEPSATSVTLHNLSRLSLIHSNEYEKYEKKAEDTYLSIGEELKQMPRAFGYSACGLMDIEKGYREVIIIGSPSDNKTTQLLQVIRSTYSPNQVIIQIDPSNPPYGLGKLNDVVKSLVDNIEAGKEDEVSLRICENGSCGLPVKDLEEAKKLLGVE